MVLVKVSGEVASEDSLRVVLRQRLLGAAARVTSHRNAPASRYLFGKVEK